MQSQLLSHVPSPLGDGFRKTEAKNFLIGMKEKNVLFKRL